MKTCSKCKENLNIILFNKDSSAKDGHYHYCRSCSKLISKERRIKDKPRKTASWRKSRTGCTPEMYEQLKIKQNNCCAICLRSEIELKKSLCADHCHKTKKVRGLLCHSCNMGIGLLKDSLDILSRACIYLEKLA